MFAMVWYVLLSQFWWALWDANGLVSAMEVFVGMSVIVGLLMVNEVRSEKKRRIQESNLHRRCLDGLANRSDNHYGNPPKEQCGIRTHDVMRRLFCRQAQSSTLATALDADSGTRTDGRKGQELNPLGCDTRLFSGEFPTVRLPSVNTIP